MKKNDPDKQEEEKTQVNEPMSTYITQKDNVSSIDHLRSTKVEEGITGDELVSRLRPRIKSLFK